MPVKVDSQEGHGRREWFDWKRLIDFACSALLVVTGVLKAYSPADALSAASAYGASYLTMMLVVQVELLVAVLLVFSCRPRQARLAAALLFVLFGCFSLMLALNGHASCGCFGQLRFSPRLVLPIDVAAAVGLLAAAYGSKPDMSGRHATYGLTGIAYGVLAAVTLTLMIYHQPATLRTNQYVDMAADLVILEPETWIGEVFPLTQYLEPKLDFGDNRSIVLIYHHDCPDCRAALPRYEQMANTIAADSEMEPTEVVLLEVPPFGPLKPSGIAVRCRLSESIEWFIQTPVELTIRRGKVISVSSDFE